MRGLFKTIYLLCLICLTANSYLAQENKVKIRFGILDENEKFLGNLQASDFQILQNKKPVSVLTLKAETENSLELVIMIDASISQENTLPDQKKAAEYLVDTILSKDKDKVAIVRFAGSVTLEQDFTNNFSEAKEQVREIKLQLPPDYPNEKIIVTQNPSPKNSTSSPGSTSIWDSLKQVIKAFSTANGNNGRKAVIIITDGVNTSGNVKLKEVIELSIKTQIPIFAIAIGDEIYGGVDKQILKKITEETGGIVIVPKKKLADLEQQTEKIKQSLRSSYEVVFIANSPESKDALQGLKIKIINPSLRKRELKILQPKGFFLEGK